MLNIVYGVSEFVEYEHWLNSARLKMLTQCNYSTGKLLLLCAYL